MFLIVVHLSAALVLMMEVPLGCMGPHLSSHLTAVDLCGYIWQVGGRGVACDDKASGSLLVVLFTTRCMHVAVQGI